MKNVLIAAVLFSFALFSGEANAQLPLPGQLTPIFDGNDNHVTDYGDFKDYFVGIYHHGAPLGSGYYDIYTYRALFRWNSVRNSWDYVTSDPYYSSFGSAGPANPNYCGWVFSDTTVSNLYGPGIYRLVVDLYAYNPNNYVKIFLWENYTVFQAY